MQDMAALSWTWIVVAGTVVLGAVLAWAMYRNSKVTPRQDAEAEAGARRIYKSGREYGPGRHVLTTPVGIALVLVVLVGIGALILSLWEAGPAEVEEGTPSTETPAVESPGAIEAPGGG
ncbi:hypothetical protein [Devosia nitrariae]|uniref:Uncharacterized protein n=1 Tax=Devosia nitrariae TaxID=2071872 RepID=A0ABQ5W5Z7_9HYPH|nr:hypothetical protein [Devosia nitrariae]GLQ55350.1 hypothetical protein GCM10010862_26090 [Devosia nitrariae]